MASKSPYIIYVTIGNPRARKPIVNKTEVEVDPDLEQTPVEMAKELRIKIGGEMCCKPHSLYYEIYINPRCKFPYAASVNSPLLNMG